MNDTRYDFETISSDRAYYEAHNLGCEVVLPEPDQLQIDIDSDKDYAVYLRNIERFEAHVMSIVNSQEKTSRSGNSEHKHVTLTLQNKITDEQRIMYQLFLGSDRVREFLSYLRLIYSDPHPTLFIEKTETKQLIAAPSHNMLMESSDDA